MAGSGDPPTLYEWAGGGEAFERLINAFYDRVEGDELISPLFPGGVGERNLRAELSYQLRRRSFGTRTFQAFWRSRRGARSGRFDFECQWPTLKGDPGGTQSGK